MKKIPLITSGDKVRIKNSCTKYGQKHNGEIGTVGKIYSHENGSYGNIHVTLDNQYNKNSVYGYFYFQVNDFDVITEVDSTSEVSPNLTEYQQKLLKMTTQSNGFVLDCNIENTIDNIGEEKMRSEKIINLWRDNQRSAIFEIINKKETEILNLDPLYSSVKNHVNEINKLLSENGFSKISDTTKYITFRSYTSSSATAQLKQNEEDKAKLQKDLDKQYAEICAMLSACDTYEQEMEVLKAYKIVGEDGKLVEV